jgi:hypothetical protein
MSGLEGTTEENTAKRARMKTSTLVAWSIIGLLVATLAVLDIAFYLKLPPILRGIAGGYVFVWQASNRNVVFSQKLAATFPSGTKEDDLIGRLKAEGFGDPVSGKYRCGTAKRAQHSYKHIHTIFPYRWNVCWSTDQAGNVTELSGRGGPSK